MRSFTPLSGSKPRQGFVGAYSSSPYAPLALGAMPLEREDEVLRNKGYGRGAELYSKLLNDPAVAEGFEKFCAEITHREWQIVAPTKEIEEFLTYQLLSLSGGERREQRGTHQELSSGSPFDSLCRGLLEAYITGMEVAEIEWKTTPRGIVANSVSLRESRRLRLVYNDKNTALIPTILQDLGDVAGVPVKPRSLIIHRVWCSHGYEPHGYGIGRQLYYLTEFRRAAMANWLAFADRFTVPTALAKYELGVPEAELDALEDGLRDLGRETQALIPQGIDLSWLEAKGDWSIYLKILTYCDEMIAMLLNGQSTVGNAGIGGSRARDQVADIVGLRKAKAHADLLAGTLNSTLLRWLTELNFPNASKLEFQPYIRWSFPELDQKRNWNDVLELALGLKDLGYTINAEWLRDYLEVPIEKTGSADKEDEVASLLSSASSQPTATSNEN